MEEQKIQVTGGRGFIGKYLVNLYRQHNFSVDITSKYYDLEENLSLFRSDYSKESFKRIFKKKQYKKIFFLSGNPYPALSEKDVNIDLEQTFIPLVNACQALKELSFEGTFWFASSVAVYGMTEHKIQSEQDKCCPLSNYAFIKLAGEEFLEMFHRTTQINCGSFRIFSTFGPELERQVVFDIFKKISENQKEISLLGSGSEVRDLSFVEDQVERIKLISDNIEPKGDVFNIGSGDPVSTKELAELMAKIMQKEIKINFSNKKRSFDGTSWIASMEKLESITKNPKTDLKEALTKTIERLKRFS